MTGGMPENKSGKPRRGVARVNTVGLSMPNRKKLAVLATISALTLAMATTLTAFFATAYPRAARDPGVGGSAGGPATPPAPAGPVVTAAQEPSSPAESSPPASSPTPAPSSNTPSVKSSVLPARATIAISGTGRDLERTIRVRVTRQPPPGRRLRLVAQFPAKAGPPLQSPWARLSANKSSYSLHRSFKDLDADTKRSLFIVDTDADADRLALDYLKQGDKFKGLPAGALQVSNSVDATRLR